MVDRRRTYRFLVRKLEKKRQLDKTPSVDERIILKWIFE
jgi:hypothetical protein